MRKMPQTPNCSMVARIQAPLPLTSGTDKAKLLNFMRPQFSHLKMWQSSCVSGCAARHLLSTPAHTSGSVGSVTICSERQSSNLSSTRKVRYCRPLPSPTPHCWILSRGCTADPHLQTAPVSITVIFFLPWPRGTQVPNLARLFQTSPGSRLAPAPRSCSTGLGPMT